MFEASVMTPWSVRNIVFYFCCAALINIEGDINETTTTYSLVHY